MSTFGRQVLSSTGIPLQVSADGAPVRRPGGITIDWATVTAVSGSDETYGDGTVVAVGKKGLPYGTILCQKMVREIQTISIDATGGTFTASGNSETTDAVAYSASAATVQTQLRALGGSYAGVTVAKVLNRWTLTEVDGTDGGTFSLRITRNGVSRLATGIAWNVSAANLDTAIEALDNIGTGGVTVSGSAGGPYTLVFLPTLGDVEVEIANDLTADGGVLEGGLALANLAGGAYVVTFPAGSGNVSALTTDATSLTGGAGTATVATATSGDATGTYGPYDPAATDGRQYVVRGSSVILNATVLEQGAMGLVAVASNHPDVIEGGLVWKARVKMGGASQPAISDVEAALPMLRYV